MDGAGRPGESNSQSTGEVLGGAGTEERKRLCLEGAKAGGRMDGTMALRPLAILELETLYWRSGIIYTPNGLFDGRSQKGPVTVSSLHTNLQIANFQRCTHTFHQRTQDA